MATTAARAAARAFLRAYVTDGIPASGINEPIKSEGITALSLLADEIDAAQLVANSAAAGRRTVAAVRVRSTANMVIASALEDGDTLNGLTLATGDRVFLGSQTAPAENGIYVVAASGAAARATDADTAADLERIEFLVMAGTVGAGETWHLPLAASAITVGTTALNFVQTNVTVDYADEVNARLDAVELNTGNLLPDPFLERLGYLATKTPSSWVGILGTWLAADPLSPFGGGSVAASSGLIRVYRALPEGFREGDTISVRSYVDAPTAPTTYLSFVDDTGAGIVDGLVFEAGAIGVNDQTLTTVIPADAVGFLTEIGDAGTAKLFALAVAAGETPPAYSLAPDNPARSAIFSATANASTVVMGDSIMTTVDVSTTPDTYIDTLLSRDLNANVINCAIGGTTMALRADATYSALSASALADAIAANVWTTQDAAATALGGDVAVKITRLKAVSWADVKLIVLFFGVNDYAAEEKALGTTADTAGTTFRGAVANIVAKLQGAYPHLQILFVTPYYSDRFAGTASSPGSISGTTFTATGSVTGAYAVGQTLYSAGMEKRTTITALGTGTGGTGTYTVSRSQTIASTNFYSAVTESGDTKTNAAGNTLTAYVDAIIEMARLNHVPVADAYRDLGWNYQTIIRNIEDGRHPSPLVGLYTLARWLARQIAHFAY